MVTLIAVLVVAIPVVWYIGELQARVRVADANWTALTKWASHLQSENHALREEGRVLRERPVVAQPPAPRGPFVPEEEAMPPDIAAALDKYPSELAEPTRLWITQQRRMRVDWDMIRRRVIGGDGGHLEDT